MKALLASVVMHGVLGGALLLAFDRPAGDVASTAPPIAIEIVAPPTLAPPPPLAPVTDVQGGGNAHTRDASPAKARRTIAARPRTGDIAYAIDRGTGIEHDGDGGEGTGIGGNRGAGIGFGDGGKIVVTEDQLVLPKPAERVVSKARPAKLIYPTRARDLGEERLFVARITVDTDGYVVGAKLVRGVTGPRDDEAAELIFRFRYLPALDDNGRAIASTFEQPFHVNR
jgi:Gram-negative bacterial TonB protein C-terminal